MIKLFQKQSILKLLLFIFLTFTIPAYSTISAYATNSGTEENEDTKGLKFEISKTEATIKDNGAGTGAEEELEAFLEDDNGFLNLVSYGGAILITFGIGQMILAFKDDNPADKAKGTMILLGGVFCLSIKFILEKII